MNQGSRTSCFEQNIGTPRMVFQILGHVINLHCIDQQTMSSCSDKISPAYLNSKWPEASIDATVLAISEEPEEILRQHNQSTSEFTTPSQSPRPHNQSAASIDREYVHNKPHTIAKASQAFHRTRCERNRNGTRTVCPHSPLPRVYISTYHLHTYIPIYRKGRMRRLYSGATLPSTTTQQSSGVLWRAASSMLYNFVSVGISVPPLAASLCINRIADGKGFE